MSLDLKVISHFLLNKTHLITGSSNIISNENFEEKQTFLAEKNTFWNFLYIQLI